MKPEALLLRMGVAAVIAIGIGVVVTPIVIAAARRLGFVASPRADRWSRKPTALMGGIAIFVAAMSAAFAFSPNPRAIAGLGVAGSLIFLVGLVDDIIHMRPQYKLLAQIVAACIVLGFGVQFGASSSHSITWPLTLLFVVGITNALNLLDNMDGLAAGVALVSAIVLAAAGYLTGHPSAAVASASLAGAALAFLAFNFSPAKVFMGDCGSMFLGMTLAVLGIQISRSATTSLAGAVLLPSTALAIPIFDTAFVTVMRKLNGRAISEGGCDHTSHRLVKLGLSERQAVLLLCGSSLVVGMLGLASMRFQAPYLLLAGALAAAGLLVMGRFLAQVDVYSEQESLAGTPRGAILDVQRMYKRQLATALIDTLLVFSAYLLSSLLVGHGSASQAGVDLTSMAMPWAVASAVVGLGLAGAYRGNWHYLRPGDMARLAIGCLLGCAGVLAGRLVHGEPAGEAFTLAAVDGVVLWLLLLAAREFYLLLSRAILAIVRSRLRTGRWLVVAPANPSPELLDRITRWSGRKARPCGVVTPSEAGNGCFGDLPHLGSVDSLAQVLTEVDPSAVLVATTEGRSAIEALCRQKGVRCLVARDLGGVA